MTQRKLEFDRKAKEKWGNVSDKLVGTTKRGGKAKKTAGENGVGGQTEFRGGQNEELHVGEDKTAGLGELADNRGYCVGIGVMPQSVEPPAVNVETEKYQR